MIEHLFYRILRDLRPAYAFASLQPLKFDKMSLKRVGIFLETVANVAIWGQRRRFPTDFDEDVSEIFAAFSTFCYVQFQCFYFHINIFHTRSSNEVQRNVALSYAEFLRSLKF